MQPLTAVLEKALPVFIMLAIGMLCRKKQLISRAGIDAMKSFAVNITLPAVMLSAFATASYSKESLIVPLIIFAVCVLMLVLGRVLCGAMKISGRLSPYLASGFEAGMLGYALFALLFPQEPTSSFAMIDLGQVLFVFTLYKALLLVLFVDRLLLGGMMHPGALVLMFILPPPYVLPVFADVEEERADVSSALSSLTLISLILFMLLTVVYA